MRLKEHKGMFGVAIRACSEELPVPSANIRQMLLRPGVLGTVEACDCRARI